VKTSRLGPARWLAQWASIQLGAEVVGATQLSGGDVAESFRLELADGRKYFAKTHRDPPPDFFSTEARGLSWLREAGTVAVPEVIAVSDGTGAGRSPGDTTDAAPLVGTPPGLILEWIDEASSSSSEDVELGRCLAALHRAGAPCFGRLDRRSTGSRALPNQPCDTWAEFFATQRLIPLARLAHTTGALPDSLIRRLDQVANRLDSFGGSGEPPARLHGDLWAGNRLIDHTGQSWLIDPAAHGGHREFDLAMMRLFGGFGDECFSAYHEVFPLSPGWERRVPLHQLAPLVVHAIKFGGGYVASTESALRAVS
jgi:fructosamine-3-kinase